jgi:L-threonylcarbamoyladenylate synthase
VPSDAVPDELLEEAAAALRAGAVVALPTDTVYGLATDPTRPGATEAVFALKGRPAGLALPVLVADLLQADAVAGPAGLGGPGRLLAETFWPGALTIVVPRRPGIGWRLGGDETTVGLRCPAGSVARRLCAMVGPLATTSANPHGAAPARSAAEVASSFGPGLLVVDGGRCEGVPSTVVDVTGSPTLLRRGGVSWEEVLAALAR